MHQPTWKRRRFLVRQCVALSRTAPHSQPVNPGLYQVTDLSPEGLGVNIVLKLRSNAPATTGIAVPGGGDTSFFNDEFGGENRGGRDGFGGRGEDGFGDG